MTRQYKLKAIELLADELVTVELNATINNTVNREFMALTNASHSAILKLMENDYLLSLADGKIIVDKFC